LFLLVEQVQRLRTDEEPEAPEADVLPGEDTNLDDEERPLVGQVLPISTALIALAFLTCALVVAGLPPLSGFVAKVSLLSAVVGAERAPVGGAAGWAFIALLLLSGLAAVVSL